MTRSNKRSLLLLAALLCICLPGAAQTARIEGKVFDPARQPVAYATVFLEKTNLAAFTDNDGRYTLPDIPAGHYTLQISYVGFAPHRVEIDLQPGERLRLADTHLQANGQLAEVTVTAKTENRRIQELPYSVAAIDMQAFRNAGSDLNQLINQTTGVRIREEGGMGSGYNFNLNGFSGKQVKFLLDGVPMDNYANSFSLGNLSPGMIERVEVYKGVVPVHLAADALGGAVNIVGRRTANYLDASYSYGSFNTHRASVNHAFTNHRTGYTLRTNLFYNYSDNDYKVWVPVMNLETKEKGPEQWVRRFHDAYQAAGLRLETGWTGRRWADDLLLGVILSGNDKEIQNGVTMERVYGAKTSDNRTWVSSLRYRKKDFLTEGLEVSLYGSYSRSAYHFTDTAAYRYNWLGERVPRESATAGEDTRSRLRLLDNEGQLIGNATYRLTGHQSLSLNYLFSRFGRKMHDKEDPGNREHKIPQHFNKHILGLGWTMNRERWTAAAFGKLYRMHGQSYEYKDQFMETERLEAFSTSFAKLGYGASASWFLLRPLQLKASYEHTYRLPEGMEMFGDGLFNQRNPDLKPESSDNLNASLHYDQYLGADHRLTVEGGVLLRHAKDFIQKELKEPSMRYVNLGRVKTFGVEGGATYAFRRLFRLEANLTWQNIRDDMEFITVDGYVGAGRKKNFTYKDRLPNIPYLFANAMAGLRFDNLFQRQSWLTLDYDLNYVHAYYLSWPSLGSKDSKAVIPRQVAHNLSAGYSFGAGRYNLTVTARNLANAKLYDNYRLQKPGRAFYLTLRYFMGS